VCDLGDGELNSFVKRSNKKCDAFTFMLPVVSVRTVCACLTVLRGSHIKKTVKNGI
jgi:hypothetical protein